MTDRPALLPGKVIVGHLSHGQTEQAFLVSLDHIAATDERVLWPPIRVQCNTDLAKGRNQLVEAWLDVTPAEFLWMLDDDMGVEPDCLDKLLQVCGPDNPVVGGLCFAYKRTAVASHGGPRFVIQPTIYDVVDTGQDLGVTPRADYARDSVIDADATGAACLLIHRSVAERMRAESPGAPRSWFDPVTIPGRSRDGRVRFSEDLSFCLRLKALEDPPVQLKIHTGAKTCHIKPLPLDEWFFDRQPQNVHQILRAGRREAGMNVGPLVSVLLPTRGRPELLRRSVMSLLDMASTPGRVEILVAVDEDDDATLEMVGELPVHAFEFEPRGYPRLHEYVNELARQALGDWLFLWNDDAIMRTAGWDDVVANADPAVLHPRDNHPGDYLNTFPIVPAEWVRRVGHFSLHRANDTWWQEVGARLGAQVPVPIDVYHDRFDLTGENADETFRATSAQYDPAGFFGPEVQALLDADAEALR